MKAPRTKQNRKSMQVFTSTYQFRQPYQVLGEHSTSRGLRLPSESLVVDADFAQMAASQNMDVRARLEAALQGMVKISELARSPCVGQR
jgi:hypothetical protein